MLLRRFGGRLTALAAAATLVVLAAALLGPGPVRSQNPDVELNVRPGQIKKINIAVPEFTLAGGSDPQNWAKRMPEITGADLTFTSLFSVVAGSPALPAGPAEAAKTRLQEFAAAGGELVIVRHITQV